MTRLPAVVGVLALVAAVGCSRSASPPRVLPPLRPASADFVSIESRQQISHGDACPPGFVPSELPGDWCYRVGEIFVRPSDIATKAVVLDRSLNRWIVEIELRAGAVRRFASFGREHPGEQFALIAGDTVVALLPVPTTDGGPPNSSYALDGPWTEQQARRVERALGGTDITRNLITLPPPPTAP